MGGHASEYLAFLLLGSLCVLIDGQVIFRGGRTTLGDVYPTAATAEAANRMVTVFFYLVMFGVLALVSTLDIGGTATLTRVVTKFGLLLLLLAMGHALAMLGIAMMRDRQRHARRSEDLAIQRKYGQGATVRPKVTETEADSAGPNLS